ncbi:hypothetical protein ACFPVY_16795 [Flavobacterium qiangtangense]|uniref:Gliding motility protein GldL-like N-terminal domain-containing protein n=1 Tax=Flavobacterium qiangtangense TaxID=1442595 RepID=A0ABW1PSD4_9FLAO
MKNKTLYIFFILGALLIIAGALLKIEHYENAGFILGAGLGLEVGAVAFFIGKLIGMKNEKL